MASRKEPIRDQEDIGSHGYKAVTVISKPIEEYAGIMEALCLTPSKQEPVLISSKDNHLMSIIHDRNNKTGVAFIKPKTFLVEDIPGGMTYLGLDGSEEKTIVWSPHFFVPKIIAEKVHALRGFYAHQAAYAQLVNDPKIKKLEEERQKPFARFVFGKMPRFFERHSTFAHNTMELENRIDEYAKLHGFRKEIDAFRKYVPQVIFHEHLF